MPKVNRIEPLQDGLRALLRIISHCDSKNQPSDAMLSAFVRMAEMEVAPKASGLLEARLERLENAVNTALAMTSRRKIG